MPRLWNALAVGEDELNGAVMYAFLPPGFTIRQPRCHDNIPALSSRRAPGFRLHVDHDVPSLVFKTVREHATVPHYSPNQVEAAPNEAVIIPAISAQNIQPEFDAGLWQAEG